MRVRSRGDDAPPEGDGLRSLSRREFLGSLGAAGVALGAGSVLAACGGATSPSVTTTSSTNTPKRGGTLRAGLSGGTSSDTLDGENQINNIDYARCAQLYDPLVGFDENARTKLVLAEEITPNATATSWTIRIRKGVTFHNGKDVTADDVVYMFQYILNPKVPAIGAVSLQPVDVSGVRAIDKYTVVVPCHTPFATLVDTLVNYTYNVIPVGFDPKHPVGTGPFKYESFTPGVQSVFTRNPDYWQTGLPYVDSLVISDFPDETSQINALLAGQVDVIDLLSFESIAAVKAGGMTVSTAAGGGWNPFTMRVDAAPFNDSRVTQAFRLIPDRPQMLDLVFGGHGLVANDLFSVWDPVYDSAIPQRTQDIDQAKFLLKQAGHENLTIELVTSDLAQGVISTAEVFAKQATAAGVTVNIRQVSVTDFYGSNYLKWIFAQDYWYYDPYFPQVGLANLPTSGFNETHYENPRYLSLYSQALKTVDETKRKEIAHEMQQLFFDTSGYIIPYFSPTIDAHSPKLGGVKESRLGVSFGFFNFKEMWIE